MTRRMFWSSSTPHGADIARRKLRIYCSYHVAIADPLCSLAPKYDELGELFSSASSKVTIAKVDATLNDVPDEIQGFPTIKLYAAGKKDSPIDYAGPRTVEDLATFIKENGSHKVDGYSADADDDSEDFAKATDDMPQQAMAASKSASSAATGAGDYVTEKIKDAAGAAYTAVADSDGDRADHDEL